MPQCWWCRETKQTVGIYTQNAADEKNQEESQSENQNRRESSGKLRQRKRWPVNLLTNKKTVTPLLKLKSNGYRGKRRGKRTT